jgi:group I intron endonuclease
MQTAYIYKISNLTTDDLYIGSTKQTLHNRYKAHKSNVNLGKKTLLYNLMREIGIDDFKIELVEVFQFSNDNKNLVGEKEVYYRNLFKPSLNMITPAVSKNKQYGLIYKFFYNLNPSDFYIGSTTKKILNRLCDHKSASLSSNTPLYKFIREKGRENFDIELIEDNINLENLIIQENFWIQKLQPTLNTNKFLCRTEKERDKAKYENNKEKIKERINKNRWENFKIIQQRKKEYYLKNKEEILKKDRNNRSKQNELRRIRRAKIKNVLLNDNRYIIQCTGNGFFISLFKSIKEASLFTSIKDKNIAALLIRNIKYSSTFIWKYAEKIENDGWLKIINPDGEILYVCP